MPFDPTRVTFIDSFACGGCGFTELYARTLAVEMKAKCPKCAGTSIYVKVMFGRNDDDPVAPSVRTCTTSPSPVSFEQFSDGEDSFDSGCGGGCDSDEWRDVDDIEDDLDLF